MADVVVNRRAIDYRSSAFEMRKTSFGDIKARKDVRIEGILDLFGTQFQQRRLLNLCAGIID